MALEEDLNTIASALDRLATVAEKVYEQIFLPRAEWKAPKRVSLNERQLKIGDVTLDIQQFKFNFAEREDVVERHVTLRISDDVDLPEGIPQEQTRIVSGAAGDTGSDLSPGRDITSEGAFEVPEGATFSLTVVALDNAGNRSEPFTQELTADDEVAPGAEVSLEKESLDERVIDDDDVEEDETEE